MQDSKVDPGLRVKQVIVVRRDLNMSVGKTAAQVAHAAMQFMIPELVDFDEGTSYVQNQYTEAQGVWFYAGYTKVVVGVDSLEEFFDVFEAAKRAELEVHIIEDEGRTEFDGVHTLTCLAVGPDHSEKIDWVTGHLDLL